MVADTQEIAWQFSHFRSLFRSVYAHEPRNKNPLPYEWPTVPSIETYLQFVCLCTPVHHLAQISNPTTREIQINLKTALYKDYLDQWISPEKRESIAAVFNSSCDLMNVKANSMDRGDQRNFEREWVKRRDQFIFSLTGDSHEVPTFVHLDLVALAWDGGGEEST
jgi:hypothetical protein